MVIPRCVVLACGSFVASASAQTNLIVDGGFENPVLTDPYAYRPPGTTFGAWRVDNIGNGVAQVGSAGYPDAIEGKQSVELNWYVTGGVNQTIPTVPGKSYVISFLMAGQTNLGMDLRQVRVDFAGTTAGTASWNLSLTGGRWIRKYVVGKAIAATSVVDFVGITPSDIDGGPYIDDVRVVACMDITEHPASSSICPGAPFTLSANAVASTTDGPIVPTWQMEDASAPGGWRTVTDGPIVIGGVTIGEARDSSTLGVGYTIFASTGTPLRSRCVLTNACGSLITDAATLTLRECPFTCVADYDASGGTPDATDIGEFFTDWLAGAECADADCSGGTPDATDINAFFAAWLAGGC